MNIRNRPIRGKYGRSVVLLLLTPMMTLHASQGTTLCVSHEGHVAIELLVEDHCSCEVRVSETGTNSGPAIEELSALDEHSASCTDLSIPPGSSGGRSAPALSRPGAARPTTTLLLPGPTISNATIVALCESPPVPVCYHIPLRSIILRV